MYKMCRDCSWRDQEDGCCWNPLSPHYLTEVDKLDADAEVCGEYEPDEETENA